MAADIPCPTSYQDFHSIAPYAQRFFELQVPQCFQQVETEFFHRLSLSNESSKKLGFFAEQQKIM
jgi:hypothetical protein